MSLIIQFSVFIHGYQSLPPHHNWDVPDSAATLRVSEISLIEFRLQHAGSVFWHCVFQRKPCPLWPHAMSSLSSCSQCLLFKVQLAYGWPSGFPLVRRGVRLQAISGSAYHQYSFTFQENAGSVSKGQELLMARPGHLTDTIRR